MELWARRDDAGHRLLLREPPLPKLADDKGVMVERPHGAVLDFIKRPPFLVHSKALITFLRFLGLRVKSDHPRRNTNVVAHLDDSDSDSAPSAVRVSFRGLIELVRDALVCGRKPITAAEAELIGTEDLIPFEYTGSQGWCLRDHADEVLRACRDCAITDTEITKWFGVNNASRSRGMKLFRRGHLDWHTLRVREARLIHNRHKTYIFQAAVTASQRVRSYNALLVYDLEDRCIVRHPASSCDCVVHIGPACSHQLCLALAIAMGARLSADELDLLPSNVAALQRLAMTISFAYGKNSINRSNMFLTAPFPRGISAEESGMLSLEAPPQLRSRDLAEPLVPFVNELVTRWRQATKHPNKFHATRLKEIEDDVASEISMYPRTPEKQRDVDELRERMYSGYLKKMLRGWDWDTPPLILYYLVYTRKFRLERLKSAPPRTAAASSSRTKICKSCGGTVYGRASKVCSICGAVLITNVPQWLSSNSGAGTGMISHILSLYDCLPGRWQVHEWEHGDAEVVTVRNMRGEGMIGKLIMSL